MVDTTPAVPVQSADPHADQLAQSRLEQLARTVGELVDKATQNERILRKFQHFELDLLAVKDLDVLLGCLLRDALQHFRLDAVELWLLDPESTLRDLMADEVSQQQGLYWLDGDAALRELYAAGAVVRLTSPPPPRVFAGRPVRSAALLPLVRHGVLIGSLHFGAFAAQRFSGDKSTDFIGHLGSIVAVCLENCANQERLHRLSLIDMLTRVENRRAFDLAIAKEIARASRQGEPLTLMLADLDHFKRINDNHGHQVGDRVLRAVAQEIAGMLRKTDHVCRYGGEEFVLVLPNCDPDLALEVAGRIRTRVAAMTVVSDTGITVPVSVSLGLSCWTRPRGDGAGLAERLLKCADDALYRAKAAGRDRVEYQACG